MVNQKGRIPESAEPATTASFQLLRYKLQRQANNTFASFLPEQQSTSPQPGTPQQQVAAYMNRRALQNQMPASGTALGAPRPNPGQHEKVARITTPITKRGNFGMEDTRKTSLKNKMNARSTAQQNTRKEPVQINSEHKPLGFHAPDTRTAPFMLSAAYATLARPSAAEADVAQAVASLHARQQARQQARQRSQEQAAPVKQVAANNKLQNQRVASAPETGTLAHAKAQKTAAWRAPQQNIEAQAPLSPQTQRPLASPASAQQQTQGIQQQLAVGILAAKFESGEEGIAAIGYDANGGTSYGKYQISSRAGTMKQFIAYLQETAPDIASRLAQAGPANTGKRTGRMPTVWKEIADAEPARFEQLQNDFVKRSHFDPAMQAIARDTGISFDQLPGALNEVLFSTAVQHGPAGAVRIVRRALQRINHSPLKEKLANSGRNILEAGKELIHHIYALRARQFGSSSLHVQTAVKNRLNMEKKEALHMLSRYFS